jgi:hypothetical protein
MNAREQLLTEAASLLQIILDRDIWVQEPERFSTRCAFCEQAGEFYGDKDTIVHLPGCELIRIQAWLAGWEVERQRPGKPAWMNPPTEGEISRVRPEDIEVEE